MLFEDRERGQLGPGSMTMVVPATTVTTEEWLLMPLKQRKANDFDSSFDGQQREVVSECLCVCVCCIPFFIGEAPPFFFILLMNDRLCQLSGLVGQWDRRAKLQLNSNTGNFISVDVADMQKF